MMRRLAALVVAVIAVLAAPPAQAEAPTIRIAVHTSLTGSAAFGGKAYLDAVRFAVDEANAAGIGPRFELAVFDDGSTADGARAVAGQVIASDAAVVLGPVSSALAIVACPIYGQGGAPAIATTVHADELTANPTTFRTVISTGEIGESLAEYLSRVLHGARAVVLSKDNGYGRPLAARFKAAAERDGINATYRSFGTPAERDAAARELGAVADQAPIVLGMTYEDAVPVMIILRRAGYHGLILGTATMARASFNDLFDKQPEAHTTRGYFTDNVYATSPMILDSANAEILAFADRYEARFHQEPSWETVQAYDGALLAMAALRAAVAQHSALTTEDPRARRAATLAAIAAFDAPSRAVQGINGPIWFTPDRIRQQAVRIGRFHDGGFESAPVQIVPVAAPSASDIASGAVFETAPGRYARLQRVVYTGLYLNGISHIDLSKSSFAADFYVWLRFAKDAGTDRLDPGDISFPNMLSGNFDPAHPAEQGQMPDGTTYRLWRVQGEFRNDFDLHEFPFDRQRLQLPFYHASAASDRVVYVVDRRTAAAGSPAMSTAAGRPPALTAPDAFNDLTQWRSLGATERRQNLVTDSSLGNLRRAGTERYRELSGFVATFDLQRRAISTIEKSLMPLLLMTLIVYATLHFPAALIKERVTVAITGALSGAVLLTAINSQLGSVGYTIAIEYAFFVFFGLATFTIFAALAAQHFRHVKRDHLAAATEHGTRAVFILAVIGLLAGAWWVSAAAGVPG
ncbi:MAG TPA: ABC transporter substrate-binding protein [Acidisphaera sp.]|nr:ABC transporter substrate-binding protein [Acidisphaera sp.]